MVLSDSARRVQEALRACGLAGEVVELPDSTRTAVEAAQAVGCRVEQIVKSLVFRGQDSGRPILIAVSGANRVRESKVKNYVGEAIAKADADWVRERTGYAIGGIPPVGHSEALLTLVDQDLLQYDEVWAAAGTPHAVFCLTPAELVRITGGQVVDVR